MSDSNLEDVSARLKDKTGKGKTGVGFVAEMKEVQSMNLERMLDTGSLKGKNIKSKERKNYLMEIDLLAKLDTYYYDCKINKKIINGVKIRNYSDIINIALKKFLEDMNGN